MFDMTDEVYAEILERYARMRDIKETLELNKAKADELEKQFSES